MIQRSPYRWDLVAPKGHIMVEGLSFHSVKDASEWCKGYISSFIGWTFETKELK